jgi:hypothetical protein
MLQDSPGRSSAGWRGRRTYCWSWALLVTGYDIFPIKVWQYNQGLYWCGTGS